MDICAISEKLVHMKKDEILSLSGLTSTVEFSAVMAGLETKLEKKKVYEDLRKFGFECSINQVRKVCRLIAAKRMEFYPE